LVITEEALHTDLGRALFVQFSGRGARTEITTGSQVAVRRTSSGLVTLYAAAAPEQGWIRPAEHGTLFVRPAEHYVRHADGCQFDCDYCYLRATSALRPVVVYTDVQAAIQQIKAVLVASPHDSYPLLNLGEYADSMVAAPDFRFVPELVEAVPGIGANLELRTKSDEIESLLTLDHQGHTTVAFSLSPQASSGYERRTAGTPARIAAAGRLQEHGYRIALKFEPMLATESWQSEFEETVRAVRASLDLSRVDHVSLGVLRWSRELAQDRVFAVRMRKHTSYSEAVPYRATSVNFTLPKEERSRMYRTSISILKAHGFLSPVYLSLESPEVIQEVQAHFPPLGVVHG
jgi:spore photoproduct lyase